MTEANETAATKPDFNGKWQVQRSENFEDYLRENGANWFIRKMAGNAKPTVEITQDGDKISIKLLSMFMSREESFTVGEEYEQLQHSGENTKAMATWEGGKLVISYNPMEGGTAKPQTVTREVNEEGEMVMTMKVGDVVAKRYFKKL